MLCKTKYKTTIKDIHYKCKKDKHCGYGYKCIHNICTKYETEPSPTY